MNKTDSLFMAAVFVLTAFFFWVFWGVGYLITLQSKQEHELAMRKFDRTGCFCPDPPK